MIWLRLHSRMCLVAAMAIAAMAVGLCAPSPVFGACGDYVTMHGHGEVSPSPPINLVAHPDREPPTPQVVPAWLYRQSLLGQIAVHAAPCRRCPVTPTNLPCQGPWCSGSDLPMPLSPSMEAPVIDPWACWCRTELWASPSRAAFYCDPTSSGRVHRATAIFHPPRFAG